MYEKELLALRKSGRFRTRRVFDPSLVDLASNDYLGLAHNRNLFDRAARLVSKGSYFSPKASQLVNGYNRIHRNFERYIASINGFEAATVVGSGFLGNLSLFEALPRKGDLLIIDEEYHASGVLAAKTTRGQIKFFAHNNAEDLLRGLRSKAKRVFVAVEGVYSMSGERVSAAVLEAVRNARATLIVDEAHSSGTIGDRLLGVLEGYGTQNVIKLGTLGKAYGSYGAYILSSRETAEFLLNRAKPIIYSTAPSLFDIAYAYEAAKFIQRRREAISGRIKNARLTAREAGMYTESLILPVKVSSDRMAIHAQKALLKEGFLVGAIRRPTVKTPQLRVILRENQKTLSRFFKSLKSIID
ncbi:MAG: pyridoxal phosphate-dependent aminotransferase family protein [Helicobacteraceae bacterium]|jgi:8-amino-7-oxononanoate synthase|nr:pyridoxal phosphate-dependent aminotransferase family protein [Helicobacteraceae bacterium]